MFDHLGDEKDNLIEVHIQDLTSAFIEWQCQRVLSKYSSIIVMETEKEEEAQREMKASRSRTSMTREATPSSCQVPQNEKKPSTNLLNKIFLYINIKKPFFDS